jgi:carbamoyl-phosphate synthase small subunit
MSSDSGTARLVLEDGSELHGVSFGAVRAAAGEVVFNTGMVGYPESLTDPSYRGQILVMTYPLIGNYGVPALERDDDGLLLHYESERIHVEGLVVADYCDDFSHWSAERSLGDLMKAWDVPGLQGVDTRALTKKLRDKGTMLGRIVPGDREAGAAVFDDPSKRNLAAEVSLAGPRVFAKGRRKVILVDCGVKNNIIRALLRRGITVIQVPWDYGIMDAKADGIILSNGPGDPKTCDRTIRHVASAMKWNIPILGICLGSQILALAAGADTFKLKYGHRGQNQPCRETGTKRCYITSQNHGYAVEPESLPQDWRPWFVNENDGTNEGIIHVSRPFFGTQFHPEASPGPDDTEILFDMFLRAME